MTLIDTLKQLREQTAAVEKATRELLKHPEMAQAVQPSEVYANIMLSVRHLEDARMRQGKAVQWCEDGISKYDRPPA